MVEQRKPINVNWYIVIGIRYEWKDRNHDDIMTWKGFPHYWPVISCLLWCYPEDIVEQTVDLPVICKAARMLLWCHCNDWNTYCTSKYPFASSGKVSQHFLLLYYARLHCMWRCNCTKQPEVKISGQAYLTYHIWAIQNGLHATAIKRSWQGFLQRH